jgi:hypothetical protein
VPSFKRQVFQSSESISTPRGASFDVTISKNVIASSEARNSQYLPYIRSVSAIVYLTTSQEIRIQIGFPETWANFNNVLAARTFLTIHQL